MSVTANDQNALVPTERIAQSILVIRGQKVIIDADLAALYGGCRPNVSMSRSGAI